MMMPFKPWEGNRAERKEIRRNTKIKKHLLPSGVVTTNGRVLQIEHAGNTHTTKVTTPEGHAIAVVKDPARKDRPIVVRHKGVRKTEPFGQYSLHSLWRGKETCVGTITLGSKDDSSGILNSLAIIPQTSRKESSVSPEALDRIKKAKVAIEGGQYEDVTKLLSPGLKDDYEGLRLDFLREGLQDMGYMVKKGIPLEKARAEVERRTKIGLRQYAKDPRNFEPDTTKRYEYRKRGLCTLLLGFVEDRAKEHNIKRLEAILTPSTTGQFLPRYGWGPIPGTVYHEKYLK